MKTSNGLLSESCFNELTNHYCFNSSWINIVKSFEGESEAYYFLIKEDEDYCFFPFIRRDLSEIFMHLGKAEVFDITTPFDYGGIIYSSPELLTLFFTEFEKYCKSKHIISAFFRFLPTYKFNFEIIKQNLDLKRVNDLIYIDLETDFWSAYSRGRKSNINKVKKLNYTISSVSVDDFSKLYSDSMNRNAAHEYFYFKHTDLEKMLDSGLVRVKGIYLHEELISSMIIIDDNEDSYYFLGATSSNKLSLNLNALLFHELSIELQKMGKKRFFLGGGRSGVYEFKRRFSKKTLPYYIGSKIFNYYIYNKLVEISDSHDNSFFPKYREKII